MIEKVTIISGDKQSGKTTRLNYFVDRTTDIGGVLMPEIDGRRYFKSIKNSQIWLAEVVQGTTAELKVGRFCFSRPAFEKANDEIITAVQNNFSTIILDEIGPLELDLKEGLYRSFDYCLHSKIGIKNLIVIVRSSLCKALLTTLNGYYDSLSILFHKRTRNFSDSLPRDIAI